MPLAAIHYLNFRSLFFYIKSPFYNHFGIFLIIWFIGWDTQNNYNTQYCIG